MTTERLLAQQDQHSLTPLLDKTELLQQLGKKIACPNKLQVPLGEYGIPRRVELMKNVFETLNQEHLWMGKHDLHHMAWPGSDYRAVMGSHDELAGAAYRGSSSLKVILPRQLHNYVHKITEPPPMPDLDVMRQYALEHTQVNRLFETIKVANYDDLEYLCDLPFEMQEHIRYMSYQSKLEDMEDGQIGLMPDREYLARLTIEQARPVLRSIARAAGLSNARKSQKHFFSLAA